jgi:hypothetical protein
MDTGTRDIMLSEGQFIENFTYDKWQQLIEEGQIDAANVMTVTENGADNKNANNGEED